jgi:hypothetical protein
LFLPGRPGAPAESSRPVARRRPNWDSCLVGPRHSSHRSAVLSPNSSNKSRRRRLRPALLLICLAGLAATPTASATPIEVGQVPAANGTVGGCLTPCTRFQLRTQAAPSYTIPWQGVITRVAFRLGPEQSQPEEWVQARVVKPAGIDATVTAEGVKHDIVGLVPPPSRIMEWDERIPAAAGEVLGNRVKSNAAAEATEAIFQTTGAEDEVGSAGSTNPAVGVRFPSTSFTQARANVLAVVEHDEDGDGYGDESQDLCPGSPIGAAACAGSLFGSNLQGGRELIVGCTSQDCLRVQTSYGGASTAVPAAGVITRWRVLNASVGEYHLRVVRPVAGGYEVLGSATGNVTVARTVRFAHISSFPTRLPIPAGGYVGISPPRTAQMFYEPPAAGSAFTQGADSAAPGATVSAGVSIPGGLLYDADVEPDADHDGYGDLTQDLCPTDPSTQGTCPLPTGTAGPEAPAPVTTTGAPTGGGPGTKRGSGGGSKPGRPRISGLKASPSHFKAAHGTTLRLRLSADATVTFTTQRKASCAPRANHCSPWRTVYSFHRKLKAGARKVHDTAMFTKAGRRQALAPGAYRLVAVAKAKGATGPPSTATLVVSAG